MNPRFLAESEKGMLWEPRVIESGRGPVEGFKEDEKGKRRASVLSSFSLSWFFRHPCFYVVCACIEFFGEVGHFIERSGFLELCVICEKLMVYRVVSYDIGERRSVQDEENRPQYWALRYTVHELWWWRRRVIDWSGLIPVWEVWVKPLEWLTLTQISKYLFCRVSRISVRKITILAYAAIINLKQVSSSHSAGVEWEKL